MTVTRNIAFDILIYCDNQDCDKSIIIDCGTDYHGIRGQISSKGWTTKKTWHPEHKTRTFNQHFCRDHKPDDQAV